MVQWVKEAWADLSPDVIVRSFSTCGITTADPAEIGCIREGMTPEADEAITAQLHQA
jgi:hypothetical protein